MVYEGTHLYAVSDICKALGGSGAENGYMGTLGLSNEYRVVYQAPTWVAAPIRPAS